MPLEDYLAPQTEAEILEQMLAAISDRYDVSEGSYFYDALAPVAMRLAIAGDRLRLVMEWGFAATTFGEYLERRAEEHGVERDLAIPATGEVTFTGDNGTVIPAGFEVSTPSTEGVPAQVYATDSEATIAGGTATVAITAVDGGAEGNVAADTITLQAQPTIPGIASVTNADPTTGGVDEETDAELLEKYLTRVRNPGSSGNIADYLNWSLEVPGVGGAAVVPLEGGPGTVTVAIVDTDGAPADGALVDLVQEYIDPDSVDDPLQEPE